MPTETEQFAHAVARDAPAFGIDLHNDSIAELAQYYRLVMKWNARLHLVAPCSPEQFATRHVLESLTIVRHLKQHSHLIDIGPGAGLPSVPCLLVRKDIQATLIEASTRKAVFLKEIVRELNLADRVDIVASRFEDIAPPPQVDAVTCRALEEFESLLPSLVDWAPPGAKLLIFGGERIIEQLKRLSSDVEAELMPLSQRRFLAVALRK